MKYRLVDIACGIAICGAAVWLLAYPGQTPLAFAVGIGVGMVTMDRNRPTQEQIDMAARPPVQPAAPLRPGVIAGSIITALTLLAFLWFLGVYR